MSVTKDGAEADLRERWNKRHGEAEDLGQPARVLSDNLHLLPAAGNALDLACGRGPNALLLAQTGLDVSAWDISDVGIKRLRAAAQEYGLSIDAQVRDVLVEPPPVESFDVIVVSHFLERSLAPVLAMALRPGGLLFYQTFSRNAVSQEGPADPRFRLDDNELLQLFPTLRVRVYREEGRLGDINQGWRDLAMLVAQKHKQ